MPVILVPTAQRSRPLVSLQRGTLRQRLHRLARQVAPRLLTFWRALFVDARQALDAERLATSLTAPHTLEAEQYVMAQWREQAEDPARTMLPLLFAEVARQTAQVTQEERQTVAGQPVPMLLLPETEQTLAREAGMQIAATSQTTLLGLRFLLRSGQGTNVGIPQQVQDLQHQLGLTPTQVARLAEAREQWQQEGRSAQQIAQGIEEATAIGLTQRLRSLAQTQAYRAVNVGQRLGMTQAAQTGPQGASGVQRSWSLGPRPCEICVQIPGMNVQGVPLDQPFHTPLGPLMDPPVHPNCQCGSDYNGKG
jgi:hypothetical protein